MASHRHSARIAAMQTLFAYEFRGGDPQSILQYIISELHESLHGDKFTTELLLGVIKNLAKIKEIIQENAPEWPYEKIAPIDRAVLEIGIFELLYCDEIPLIVSIDESIEIAKSFGEINSGRFVNGVLSSVMKKYCEKKPASKN